MRPRPRSARTLLAALAVAAFAAQVVRTAWLSDDAFITLRTVDHLVHGRGLVWNLGERVQVYTHPLWMFLVAGVYAFGRDPAQALYVVAGLATAGFVALLVLAHGRPAEADGTGARLGWGVVVALGAALASKAFVEYSTSGLENPLTHLLVAATYWLHLGRPGAVGSRRGRAAEAAGTGRLRAVALAGALVALNRLDAVLLVAPALALEAWRALRAAGTRRTLGALAVGLAPLVLWELFSLFYYGFPFPNTAYAKLETGLGRDWHVAQGLRFLAISARKDPATVAALLLGLTLALRSRAWSAAVALVAYVAYVVWVGGDFMVGRFLTPPLALALVVVARWPFGSRPDRRHAPRPLVPLAAAGALLALGLASPASPLRLWTGAGPAPFYADGISDERVVYAPFTSPFRDGYPGGAADSPGAVRGREASAHIDPANPAARYVALETIGFLGFYADPELHVIDPLALAAPLLARLPVEDPATTRIGHFRRAAPQGYMRWLVTGEDALADRDLARFATALRLAVSGPLWSTARLRAIGSLHFGAARRGLRAYVRRSTGGT